MCRWVFTWALTKVCQSISSKYFGLVSECWVITKNNAFHISIRIKRFSRLLQTIVLILCWEIYQMTNSHKVCESHLFWQCLFNLRVLRYQNNALNQCSEAIKVVVMESRILTEMWNSNVWSCTVSTLITPLRWNSDLYLKWCFSFIIPIIEGIIIHIIQS